MIRITEKDLKLFENCECDKIGTNQLVAEIRASHDEIEKLKAELQQRRASDGWVSVGEKLPEEGQKCIGFQKTGTVYCRYERQYFYREADPCDQDRIISVYYPEVTHWQPLPPPPQS